MLVLAAVLSCATLAGIIGIMRRNAIAVAPAPAHPATPGETTTPDVPLPVDVSIPPETVEGSLVVEVVDGKGTPSPRQDRRLPKKRGEGASRGRGQGLQTDGTQGSQTLPIVRLNVREPRLRCGPESFPILIRVHSP